MCVCVCRSPQFPWVCVCVQKPSRVCVCVCVCVCVQKPPVLQVGSQSDSSWGDWKDVRVRSDGVELSFRRVKLECSQVGYVSVGAGWFLGASGGPWESAEGRPQDEASP